MEDKFEIYSYLLKANEEAFEQGLFKVAYHALSGAMYAALHAQDAVRMNEIRRIACDQWLVLKNHSSRSYPTNEPSSTTLYAELIDIVESRCALLRNNSST